MVDEDKVTEEAKEIMDDFVEELDSIDLGPDFEFKRTKNIRDESAQMIIPSDFRRKILDNAPEIDGKCIKAEKKKW